MLRVQMTAGSMRVVMANTKGIFLLITSIHLFLVTVTGVLICEYVAALLASTMTYHVSQVDVGTSERADKNLLLVSSLAPLCGSASHYVIIHL